MKSVYFWIGVLLFVVCAVVFINEHGKFYEYFDGTNAAASSGPTDASGNPISSVPAIQRDASGNPISSVPAIQRDASGNPISSGAPGVTTSTTFQILGSTVPQTNLAPGSTGVNPTASAPSQQDFRVLVDAIANFSYAVQSAGGKAVILGKLSPGDATYFNTLYAMIATLGNYADPTHYPYSASQTSSKILEFQTSTQYITNQLPHDTPGNTTLQQTTAAAVLASLPPPPGSSTSTSTSTSTSRPASMSTTATAGTQGLFTQNAAGTPGGQGQMPLNGQFTLNGNPTSNYIPNTSAGSIFSSNKKDTDMCDASDLLNLIELIKNISANLKALNTSDPTVMARINNIDSLVQDLQDMNTKIQQGSMDPSTIPIRVGDARNFLSQSTIVQNQLPKLISMPGSSITQSPATGAAAKSNNLNPANLLQMAQYLQGSINLSFDGSSYAREQMAKRVDNIIMLLQTKQISSADAQNILQALTSIHDQTAPAGYDDSTNSVFTSSWQATGGMPPSAKPGYLPAPDQLAKAAYDGGEGVLVRPGSDSDSYKKRASAAYAAYATTDTAGGPDYKSMLQNLCTQVSKSGLDMGDIGCINVQNVRPDYGYKGTYLMVCNRLKDTWGGNYPQMFGCPS